jgi:ferredoxin-thioredoxin reductase catalytic subunit
MSKKNDAIDGAIAAMTKPEKKNGKYKPTKEQEQAVLEFAIKNKCVVNPQGWNSALEDFNEFRHCVCDATRPTCPCEQAPQEIAEKGHCKCHLFWKDYEVYMKAKNLIESKQEPNHGR